MEEALPPRPCSSGMTFWSRHHPIHMAGNTDHWTKLKIRSNTYRATQSAGVLKLTAEHELDPSTSLATPSERYKYTEHGDVQQLPSETFNDSMLASMDGQAPGDHNLLVRPTSNLQRRWMNNTYQQRARSGFRYWLINRPHPTNFGKYGMGSYKMVMGIGMAPRT